MTTQTLSPFPSAFPPRPPLAHARLDADGAKNLPLWTAPSLWRALSAPRRNAFIRAVGGNGIGGPGADSAAFPCGEFPDGANLPLFAVAVGPGGLLMMDDSAGRMQGGNATISLTNALEWAALLCAWTLRETAKVLPIAPPAESGAFAQRESGGGYRHPPTPPDAHPPCRKKTALRQSDIWTRAANCPPPYWWWTRKPATAFASAIFSIARMRNC